VDILVLIDDATARLADASEEMTDEDAAGPSLLEGWSRAHVLTHVARNADALRNLLIWARTGVETPAYAAPGERDAGIEAGAGRTAAELAADIRESGAAFSAEAAMLTEQSWLAMVSMLDGAKFPAELILPRRLVEVELHYTDLGRGYTRADWPPAFAELDLPEPMRTYRATR
jgi:maleylpyruvate isomerase